MYSVLCRDDSNVVNHNNASYLLSLNLYAYILLQLAYIIYTSELETYDVYVITTTSYTAV